VAQTLWQLIYLFLDVPFLLLPIVALFLPEIRKSRPRVIAALFLGYLFVAVHPRHPHHIFRLEPTIGDWVNVHGVYEALAPKVNAPIFLHTGVQVLLTIASFGGLLCLIASLLRTPGTPPAVDSCPSVSRKQLGVLLAPFTIAYILLLIPSAATVGLFDRYTLGLLVVALICLVRYYQDRIQPRVPLAGVVLVGIMAIYGIAVTHNLFSFYRARLAIAADLRAAGVPDTSVDNGWEYNMPVELQHADFLNNFRIVLPANAYVPTPPLPAGTCSMKFHNFTPHIHPLYGISFDPNACYGSAPFAPVTYSRWLASKPSTLYVVNYVAPSKQ
jgi:hypothetical protein